MKTALAAGFADPVDGAQGVFRALLAAMAAPGTIAHLPAELAPPAPMTPGCAALCLMLADLDTPLWLDRAMAQPAVRRFLQFHCGAPEVERPAEARFALVADPTALPPLDHFDLGSDEQPELSATLIVQVAGLRTGAGRRLCGPGIDREVGLEVDGLSDGFWQQRRRHQALFPLGVDMILVAGTRIAALPRSTRLCG